MHTAQVFDNRGRQAVRLPKDCCFDEEEVYVKKLGNIVILFSKSAPWSPLVKSLEAFTDDFLAERDQGELNRRASF
jgi:antitoxin VapB